MDISPGTAVVISRGEVTDRIDDDGVPMMFYPSIECTIVTCYNLIARCDVQWAGSMFNGQFVMDHDLLPVDTLYSLVMKHRQDQEDQQRPHGDPGE